MMRGFHQLIIGMAMCFAGAAVAAGTDIEAEWREFLATAEAGEVYDSYREALEIEAGTGDLDPATCREGSEAVARALAAAPVGASVHYLAYRCAEAMGDEDAADQHLARFGDIAKYALGQASDDWNGPPIRVVAGRDVYTLLRASGLELRYEYLELRPLRRYMTIYTVSWDPQTQRERHLRFDYLDTLMALQREQPPNPFPSFRHNTMLSMINNLADGQSLAGHDMQAVMAVDDISGSAEVVARLRPVAELGGLQSTVRWLHECIATPFEGCGEGLVDALLPQVEQGHGLPTLLLAFAYADGIGVTKDEAAAEQLLDRVEALWGAGRATIEYSRYHQGLHGDRAYPAFLQARLDRLAADGNPYVAVMQASQEVRAGKVPDAGAKAIRRVQVHADAGVPSAVILLAALHYDAGEDPALTAGWVRRAAELGDAGAQDMYARLLHDGKGVEVDAEAARSWSLRAASGGDVDAMRTLGWAARQAGDWAAAAEWFRSGAIYGDTISAMELAAVHSEPREGMEADPAFAVRIYSSLDTPDARRALAYLHLEGMGVEKDPAKAIELYEHDAKANDSQSLVLLALGWLEGDFGEADREKGMQLIQPALDEGNVDVMDGYAFHLFYRSKQPGAASEALDLWRRAGADGEHPNSQNNLAWVLCTGKYEALRSPEDGLAAARKLGEPEELPAGYVDTVAACHAATGDFKEAVRVQQLAVTDLEKNVPASESLEGMKERLALYAEGKPYFETEAP